MKTGAAAAFVLASSLALAARAGDPYRSPENLAFSPDGAWLAVSDVTGGLLTLLDGQAKAVTKTVPLKGQPRGLAWHNGLVYVAEYDAGAVAEVDPAQAVVKRRLAVGPKPWGVALDAAAGRLLVTEFGLARLIAVDLASGKEVGRVPVLGLPRQLVVTPDGSSCLVVNTAPVGDAREGTHSCAITVVDLKTLAKVCDIALPPGGINPRGIAVSPDGKWAYLAHGIGRFTLPTTQLERGWIMTSALTILDLTKRAVHATILLDTITSGSADPWGLALTPDGRKAWIAIAGCNELMRLDLGLLHSLLDGTASKEAVAAIPRPSVWHSITNGPASLSGLVNDLAALYVSGARTVVPLPGVGPRGVAVSPKGGTVAAAQYFSGALAVVADGENPEVVQVSLGPQPAPDKARKGEAAFHSAELCFQRWLSCASCHPDGRADGLNWDLLNDGMGNPKNTKSMVWSHKTPPVMAHGVRDSMETATKTGFMFIQFRIADEAVMDDVREYLRSLAPEKSPYLVNGELSAKAKKGKTVFERPSVGCAQCHPAPLFTDLKMYDVGTKSDLDTKAEFDNPTCVEMWRSFPYLHDGSAATLPDMFGARNKNDRHGKTSDLPKEDMEALVEYVLSL